MSEVMNVGVMNVGQSVELPKIIFKTNPETPSQNLRFSISFQHDWFSIPAIFHFILEGARLMVLDGALWYL